MSDFVMPSLGAGMESGTLVEWLVKTGDHVNSGDIVAVVETEKGAIEVEIFQEGVVTQLLVPVGMKVPVGAVLARLDGEAPPTVQLPPRPEPTPPAAAASPPPAAIAAAPRPSAGARRKVSPAARRRAAELGVDVAGLRGTGVEGSVCLADVAQAGRGQGSAAQRARRGFDPATMRQAIAAAMSRSNREIPHYFLSLSCDMSRALGWLEAANAARPVPERLLPAALLLKATALALRQVPELNGYWLEDRYRAGDGIHVGWAITLRGGGLVAPAIRDADRKPLSGLMAAMRGLVQRARSGGLRSSEMTDATITVTNLGERGAETVLGVIYPPQVALVGFGRITERPWISEGRVQPRPLVTMSLAGDHRASDGHIGGRLLGEIDRLLQEPEAL
jgi:pyruvate dehydrogenase E2 component (dihydrolipoamide acetyltransferase)